LAVAGLKKIIYSSLTSEEEKMLKRAQRAVELGLIQV